MKKFLKNSHRLPFLSVVVPAYNEVENFKRGVLGQIGKFLRKLQFSSEVILINDGSTDGTEKLLANFVKVNPVFRLVNKEHGGKLKAIEAGVAKAAGEVILFTDFDQSTPISEFNKLLPHLKKGADLVIGSRMSKGSKRINDPFFRYFRSKVLNFIIKIFLFGGISDTQCGFKAGKAKVFKILFEDLKVTRMTKPKGGFMGPFDIELLYLAKKLNYKIVEVPVTWQYFPSRRLSIISEPTKFLFDIARIRLFNTLGNYNSRSRPDVTSGRAPLI